MPINILMPALSPTMESGTLAKWHVEEGDSVAAGDVIAEIETDKATMEVEAVEEGRIGRLLVAEGTTDIPVNETIAVLLENGEDDAALGQAGPAVATVPPPAGVSPGTAPPAGPAGAEAAPDVATAVPRDARDRMRPGEKGSGDRLIASPLARRIARQAGIDLAGISGSGPRGRIIKRDVEEAIAAGAAGRRMAKGKAAGRGGRQAASMPVGGKTPEPYAEGTFDFVPHDTLRRVIAARLTESKRTIPHFYLSLDCCLDPLLALRADINAAAPRGDDGTPAYRISVNDFIVKAMALALRDVPDANVTWTDEGLLRHRVRDVGVAVAIPGGLITPVVRRADEKTLAAISNEMKDFAARARTRKLMPEEYQGGSTVISNLGMFGIRQFSAVINPPHATILAVGAGERRPVANEDGSLGVATVMTVTLSTDHRAVDGALGARLLGAFRHHVERPAAMLV